MRPASVGFHCPDDVALAAKTVRQPRTTVGATLRDSPPYVTGALIAINVAIYLITGVQSVKGLGHPGHGSGTNLFDQWQMFPQAVHDQSQYYRLITSAFLHLSLLHIGSNMLALFFVGPPLERLLGRWRFLSVYVISALGGSAAIYAFGAVNVPVVGASGAIFGLFGACLVLVRRLGLDLQWLAGIIVLNFVFTFSIPGISKLAHIGGFVAGCLSAVAIGGLPQSPKRLTSRQQSAGLGALAAVVVGLVVWRTATF